MKAPRLREVLKQLAVDQGSPVTRFDAAMLRQWFGLPPMHGRVPDLARAWERQPLRRLLSDEVLPEVLPRLSPAEAGAQGDAAQLPQLFRTVVKKFAACVHHAEEWGLRAEDLGDYLLAIKAHLLASPFLLGALDAEELTVLLLAQADWRLLGKLDLLEAKKRFLQLLPRMEFDELVCGFEVLRQSLAAQGVPDGFAREELLLLTDYIAAAEPQSPYEATTVLHALGQSLGEAMIDHAPLFARLLAALEQPRAEHTALIPSFLLTVADLRLDLGEKALLDLFQRVLGVRGLPQLRRLLCALIILKKVVYRRSPRFSLQYECYLAHFLERYRRELGRRREELCPRDGVIAAYCRHFLARSAGSAELGGCAAAVAEALGGQEPLVAGFQSFSRGHVDALRFMRNLGLRVQTEAPTRLGAVDFRLPELGLYLEHSGAAHALHFRPQLWSGCYVLRCNLLRRELPGFFEVRGLDDLRRLLAHRLPRLSLRAAARAGARGRMQRRGFDRLYAAAETGSVSLEDQLEFPVEEYARELDSARQSAL